MYYDLGNMDYVSGRFNKTIVNTKKGEPFYIERVRHTGTVEGVYLERFKDYSGETDVINFFDIDPVPVKLGYINKRNSCFWASRIPSRSWQQGLCGKNISGYMGDLCDYSMYKTIKGIYPSFEEALHSVKNGFRDEHAFSRNFSVSCLQNILYKGKIVGSIKHEYPQFLSQCAYLEERFKRVVSK